MYRAAILLLAAALSAGAASPEHSAAPERFEIGYDSAIVSERGPITTCVLFHDSQVHKFVPPANMRLMVEGLQKKIVFTGTDLDTTVTIQLLDEKLAATSAAQLNRIRQQVRERYPQGRIVEEGECYTSDGKGCSFDVDYEVENIFRRARVCFVPIRDRSETVMFTLATSAATFTAGHLTFMTMVGSFETRPPK